MKAQLINNQARRGTRALLATGAVSLTMSLTAGTAAAAPRTHDGFQFRGAVGGGFLADALSYDGATGDTNLHGGSGGLELFFGGTSAPGVIVGGFVSYVAAPGPKLTVNGETVVESDNDVSLNFWQVAPYINWYPDPSGGIYLLGALGLAGGNITDSDTNRETSTATGFTLGAGIGYDWWVSGEWSLGILGRFSWAELKATDQASVTVNGSTYSAEAKTSHSVISPGLYFSFQYQ